MYYTICTLGCLVSAVNIGFKFHWIFALARVSILFLATFYSCIRQKQANFALFLISIGNTHRFTRESFLQEIILGHEFELISYSLPLLILDLSLKNVILNTKEGDIVVLHDSIKASRNMQYTLPRMLKHFTKKGYEFKRIPELIQ